MKKLKTILLGGLAAVGALVLALFFLLPVFLRTCEREVLSRSVSPNGDYSAEHIRELCNGKFEVGLFIGPARSGVGEENVGRTVFRSQSDRDKEYALSIKPFKLWWVGEEKLHVEYPKRESFDLSGKIGKFEIEIQRTE